MGTAKKVIRDKPLFGCLGNLYRITNLLELWAGLRFQKQWKIPKTSEHHASFDPIKRNRLSEIFSGKQGLQLLHKLK